MKRRGFLKRLVDSAGAMALWGTPVAAGLSSGEVQASSVDLADTPYKTEGYGAFSIMQGITGPTQTQVNVLLPKAQAVSYRLVDLASPGTEFEPSFLSRASRDSSDWA